MDFISSLVDLVFPSRCIVCGRIGSKPLCDSCLPGLPYISGPMCSCCGQPTSSPVKDCRFCRSGGLQHSLCRSVMLFEGCGRQVIHSLKYENGRRVAPILAEQALLRLEPAVFEVDAITFIPLHRRKQAGRGYNQAELIARELGRRTKTPVERLLVQRRRTKDQAQLSAEERRENVKGAYGLAPIYRTRRRPLPESVLLVDDVLTTGATSAECCEVLRTSGVAKLKLVTLARAPAPQ